MQKRDNKKAMILVGDLVRSNMDPDQMGLVIDEFLIEHDSTAPYSHKEIKRALFVRWLPIPYGALPDCPVYEKLLTRVEKSKINLNKSKSFTSN